MPHHQRPEIPVRGSFRPIVRREALEMVACFLPALGLEAAQVGLPDPLPAKMPWSQFVGIMDKVGPKLGDQEVLSHALEQGFRGLSMRLAFGLLELSPDPFSAMMAMSSFMGVRLFPAVCSVVERVDDYTTRIWMRIPEPLEACDTFFQISEAGTIAQLRMLGDPVRVSWRLVDERTAVFEIRQERLRLWPRIRAWLRGLRGHRAALELLRDRHEEVTRQLEAAAMARREALESRRSAEDALRIRNAFLRRISHELRTPLHQCLSLVELGLSEQDAEQRREVLEMAHKSGWELVAMVDGLLDLAELDSAAMRIEPRWVELGTLLSGLVSGYLGRAGEQGRELVLEAEEGLRVYLDPKRLLQVLHALLDNALSHGRGQIRVSAHALPEGVSVQIDDQGAGPSAIPKLGLFEVGDERTTRSQDGLGLGLTLAPRLLKAMGAELELIDAPGGGTRARVVLPTQVELSLVA